MQDCFVSVLQRTSGPVVATSEREGLLPTPSVTLLLMFLESSRKKDVRCENFEKCTFASRWPVLDIQRKLSKFLSNYFSQLYILNQLHALVYKTKPSKIKVSTQKPFFPL